MSTYHWLNFPGPKNVQYVSVQLIIYITISTITSVRPSFGVRAVSVRHKNFFLLKSPWNHPLTPGVDPRG